MAGRFLLILAALVAFLVGAVPALAWTWPVDGPVLQPFGFGGDPYAAGQHRGIDVSGATGEPVAAPAPGVVAFAGTVPGAGRTVTIHTADGYAVTLLHLGAVSVARGEVVREGEVVGAVGPSGDPEHSEPYVHLGIRIASDPQGYVDPLAFLPSRAGAPPAEPAQATGPPSLEAEQGEAVASPSVLPATTPEVATPAPPVVVPAEPVVVAPPPPSIEAPAHLELAAAPVVSVPEAGPSASPGGSEPSEQPGSAEPIAQPKGGVPDVQAARGEPGARSAGQEALTPSSNSAGPARSPSEALASATTPESERTKNPARQAGAGQAAAPVQPHRSGAADRGADGSSTREPMTPIRAGANEIARSDAGRAAMLTDPVTLALLAGLGVALLALRRPAGGTAPRFVPDPSSSPGPVGEVAAVEAPRPSAVEPCRPMTHRAVPIRRRERPNPRRIIASDGLLRHDTDLLRQLDAAHRPRVLDDRGGYRRAPPPPAR